MTQTRATNRIRNLPPLGYTSQPLPYAINGTRTTRVNYARAVTPKLPLIRLPRRVDVQNRISAFALLKGLTQPPQRKGFDWSRLLRPDGSARWN